MPKGVECPHAGYVNLALSYADYFDLMPGMDATSLTSSLGYDGSISEMYSAWVSGCAVVMLTKEQIRSARTSSASSAKPRSRYCSVRRSCSPPSQLPPVDLPYPICRYIVPAGEAFPSALVEPWTRGRRQIINTYGPTEASTDTSRQSLRPGEPITIGSPFANVTYVILAVDELRPLPHGEVGELCIGGVHARGYRNLPELTAEKFIAHPQFGRLYRTGDKCKIDIQTQRVHFLGRLDAQLKVRGIASKCRPLRHSPDAVQRDRGRRCRLPERGACRLRRGAFGLRRKELVSRSSARGVGCPGDGGPCQTTSRAVGPDKDLTCRKIRHEPGLGQDRPEVVAKPISSAEKRRAESGVRPHWSARGTRGKEKSSRLMPMRVWTLRMRKYWRSAGPCSRRSWDWMMGSLRLVGIRSSSRAWRSNYRLRDGRCLSGRCSVTATLHEKWRAARERSGGLQGCCRPGEIL